MYSSSMHRDAYLSLPTAFTSFAMHASQMSPPEWVCIRDFFSPLLDFFAGDVIPF